MLNAIFCHLLCASHRLSMARATQGLSTLETDLQQHLCPLPSARRMGYAADASRCAPRQAGGLSLSVVIIDIQSVKTVSKGGSADMTQAKRSKAR